MENEGMKKNNKYMYMAERVVFCSLWLTSFQVHSYRVMKTFWT